MKILRLNLILLGGVATGAWLLHAQAPAGGGGRGRGTGAAPSAPSPAIDFSGYWTGNMHEDGAERGAGPERVDY